MSYYKLAFKQFSEFSGFVQIPPDTILFRGIDTLVKKDCDVIRDAPIYLAPEDVARHYGSNLYKVASSVPLKLIDIRRIQSMMPAIIRTRKYNDPNILQCIKYLSISLGLVTYNKQIELLKEHLKNFNFAELNNYEKEQYHYILTNIRRMEQLDLMKTTLNPIEQEGVRIAETFIDSNVMLVLKELFQNICDGFIAPTMMSPFHNGGFTHEEIVVFDPIRCQLKIVENTPNLLEIHVDNLLQNDAKKMSLTLGNIFNSGDGMMPQDKNKSFENINSYKMKKRKTLAKRFAKSLQFKLCETISPKPALGPLPKKRGRPGKKTLLLYGELC